MIEVRISGFIFHTYTLVEGARVVAVIRPGWARKSVVVIGADELIYVQRFTSDGLAVLLTNGEMKIVDAVFSSASNTAFQFGDSKIGIDVNPHSNKGRVLENERETGTLERCTRSYQIDVPKEYPDVLNAMIFLAALTAWG